MIIRKYREIFECDTEAEISTDWPNSALIHTKENGGKNWILLSGQAVEITGSPFVSDEERTNWNAGGYDGNPTVIDQDSVHRFTTDSEKTTWNGKAEGTHNHDLLYEPVNSNIQSHISSSHAPSNAQKNSDITKAEIEAKLTGEIGSHTHVSVPSEAFPVGSVFISIVSTNPATLLGYGTWVAFGAGKVLIGLDSGDADFNTEEETGGAKTKTLSVAEIPSHTHIQNAHTHTQDAHSHTYSSQTATTGGASSYEHGAIDASSTAAESSISTNTSVAVNQNTTAVNQNTGGDTPFNIMNPYIVVRFWKRTA